MKSETLDSNVHLRMQSSKLDVIDRAANSLGINRSQFMTNVAFEEATNVLLDQRLVRVESNAFDEILEWLESPKSASEHKGIQRLRETKVLW